MIPYAQMLADGATYAQIADLEDIDADALRMRCVRAGLRSINKGRPAAPDLQERVTRAREMLARGTDKAIVARRLRMSQPALRMMLLRAERAGR